MSSLDCVGAVRSCTSTEGSIVFLASFPEGAMPTVYYPPNVVEILSGKTREPLCGIDFTNYTVAISPLGPGLRPAAGTKR
jgi:hypothetical protein